VVDFLSSELATRPVVATTALAVHHPLIASSSFDVVIVDEAGQVMTRHSN
jgi:superfamily I DNA and/or RNA helicase